MSVKMCNLNSVHRVHVNISESKSDVVFFSLQLLLLECDSARYQVKPHDQWSLCQFIHDNNIRVWKWKYRKHANATKRYQILWNCTRHSTMGSDMLKRWKNCVNQKITENEMWEGAFSYRSYLYHELDHMDNEQGEAVTHIQILWRILWNITGRLYVLSVIINRLLWIKSKIFE